MAFCNGRLIFIGAVHEQRSSSSRHSGDQRVPIAFGYDDSGAAIEARSLDAVSVVPEPSPLMMLAVGPAGMTTYRGAARTRRGRHSK